MQNPKNFSTKLSGLDFTKKGISLRNEYQPFPSYEIKSTRAIKIQKMDTNSSSRKRISKSIINDEKTNTYTSRNFRAIKNKLGQVSQLPSSFSLSLSTKKVSTKEESNVEGFSQYFSPSTSPKKELRVSNIDHKEQKVKTSSFITMLNLIKI